MRLSTFSALRRDLEQEVLDLADKFLDKSGQGHQQEDRLETLKAAMERIAELAQLAEGFESEPSKA
jgi:hypothetical protein